MTKAIGVIGLLLWLIFAARFAMETTRFDLAFLAALAIPTIGLGTRTPNVGRNIWAVVPLIALAAVIGFSPGLFLQTLTAAIALVVVLAAIAAAITRSIFGAWLVMSAFVIAASVEVAGGPILSRILFRDLA